jgi:hypothetical protein
MVGYNCFIIFQYHYLNIKILNFFDFLKRGLWRRVPDYTTPDWVHSLQEGTGPRFGEKPWKTTEIWVWVPSRREITHVTCVILKSKSEICTWSFNHVAGEHVKKQCILVKTESKCPAYFRHLFKMSGSAPGLLWRKFIGPYIWVNIV